MRSTLGLLLILGCLVAGGCGAPSGSGAGSGVVDISVWHPWGGVQKEKFDRVVEEFNRAHPNIRVLSVFTPNDLSNNQKFFTAVAANTPPDVTFVDGQQTAAWAEQGALQPLDGLIKREGIGPGDCPSNPSSIATTSKPV